MSRNYRSHESFCQSISEPYQLTADDHFHHALGFLIEWLFVVPAVLFIVVCTAPILFLSFVAHFTL